PAAPSGLGPGAQAPPPQQGQTPATNANAGTPNAGATPATSTLPPALMRTYLLLRSASAAFHSYESITPSVLARTFTDLTFVEGTASSTNEKVVSYQVLATDRVVLAVKDDAGCAWLRDFGAGPQVVRQTQLVITCSAAAAPTTGWAHA